MTEGISYGITDANGYNNKSVTEDPEIIFLGSSHLQGMCVMQKENMCYLLDEKFEGKYHVYNMGVSGHTLYKVTQYLENSLNIFEKKPKYVIIETSSVTLTEYEVQNALHGKVKKTEVVDTGVLAEMQKIPFFRQMYHQLDGGILKMLLPNNKKKADSASSLSVTAEQTPQISIDEKPYDLLMNYFQKIEQQYNTQIVIMFHPFESLHSDGSISFAETECAKVFSQYAEKQGIGFVDMTEDFENMYYENHHVPHGFPMGKLGVGHINKYGHAAVADKLYNYISALEE